MSMAYPFVAVVSEAGDYLHFDDAPAFYRYLKKFAATEVIVTVKRRPRRQGTQAMRYYRGVVVPDIAHACGVTDPDDYEGVHDALAWKFLKLPDSAFGTPRRRSTAKDELAQDELSKYIDEVITYAETSIPGCRVRRPEEVEIDDVVDPGWR